MFKFFGTVSECGCLTSFILSYKASEKKSRTSYSWKNTTPVTIYTYLRDRIKKLMCISRQVCKSPLFNGNWKCKCCGGSGAQSLLTIGQRFTFKPCSSVVLLLPSPPLPHTWLPPV